MSFFLICYEKIRLEGFDYEKSGINMCKVGNITYESLSRFALGESGFFMLARGMNDEKHKKC